MARFVDLDLDFTRNPITNDVSLKYNDEAVKRSIRNIVLTNTGEKPYIPEFGGNVKASLFENFTPVTVVTLKGQIETAIRNFEPRANLLKVEVTERIDSNELIVSIVFSILNSQDPITLEVPLERIR
jgi:phage baseplate assembly protein W